MRNLKQLGCAAMIATVFACLFGFDYLADAALRLDMWASGKLVTVPKLTPEQARAASGKDNPDVKRHRAIHSGPIVPISASN